MVCFNENRVVKSDAGVADVADVADVAIRNVVTSFISMFISGISSDTV